MARVSLDTSVIVEYIDLKGEYHTQARAIFDAVLSGRLEALIPHPVLSEAYYVASRIYESVGLKDPEGKAAELVGWLHRLPSVRVVGSDLDLAIEAGKVKLRYGLALTDCYVLATAKVYNAKAVFRHREAEMKRRGVIDEITREYPVLFLEDYG